MKSRPPRPNGFKDSLDWPRTIRTDPGELLRPPTPPSEFALDEKRHDLGN